jgi:uncharacterized membrane protein YphA (DoxX/SURF4 family)
MNTLAWTLQLVCATAFLTSGTMKSLMSKERMIATGQTGVAPFPLPLLRVVALAELAGVLGLLLPWATDTGRALTPTAAACLAVIMVGAAVSHASLREPRQVLFVNIPLFAALVAIVLIRVPQL